MDNYYYRWFSFVMCCFIAQSVAAQKLPRDPRPLHGLNRGAIPAYSSIEAFLQAHPAAGDLRLQAIAVGSAAFTPRAPGALQPLGAGKRAGLTSQVSPMEAVRVQRASNGTVRWMQGRLGQPDAALSGAGKRGPGTAPEGYVQAAEAIVQQYAAVLGLNDPAEELRPLQARTDALGYVHARFEQEYEGVPVWGRDLYVHFDEGGAVYAINGSYEPTPKGLSTVPGLSAAAAREIVTADLKAGGRWAPLPEESARRLGIDGIETRLVLYPDPERGLRLAYEVSLHPNLIEYYTYLIEAQTGEVLSRIARHCSARAHEDLLPPPDVESLHIPGAAEAGSGSFLNASGVGLDGIARQVRVYRHDDGTHYLIWDLPNLDAQAFQFPNLTTGGIVTYSAGNTDATDEAQMQMVSSADNTWNDPSSISAHNNAHILYAFYHGTFDRKAIDGQDSPILSVVHVTQGGQPMDNAYWNGRFMAYGDGRQLFTPFAGATDVAAHEMTHGVVEHTAGLIYQFQSGALNESFADVFGLVLDPEDFLIGEDIMLPGAGPALRDMLNPQNPQLQQPQPASMGEYMNLTIDQDNGGVHINSGIPNRAAALLIQAVGHDKVAQIYYRALTNYLTRNSQFGDARNAVEQSAKDLYGDASPEVVAVQQAFDAVGITETTGTGGAGGNDLPPQAGGQSIITFLLEDGSIGILDVTDRNNVQVGTFEDPAARARVNIESGDFAQLSTPRSGGQIFFINQQGQLAFVELANQEQFGQVFVFPDLFLQQQGDLWNASVSPDGNFVALESAYADDPTLYIFNGEEVGAIPLTPETTQDGIHSQTIKYPDVVAWSPHPQVPRIAFDAYNEVALKSGPISYWSMYEYDFEAGRLYNLLPAQPAGISVGNIAYSNMDPDLITFNAFDESNTWDVMLGNFAEGQLVALGLPSYTLQDGSTVTDAQRPTFSPDDSQLCFTSASLALLLFFDFASQGLSVLDLGVAAFNPRWFMLGGSGGSQNQAPTASFSLIPANGQVPLQVTFDAAASSDPNGDELTYRWEFGDGSVAGGTTAVHTYAQVGAFTVTLTVTDGGGLSGTTTQQVEVSGGAIPAESGEELPKVLALHQNYPNPFNPTTLLRFDLPKSEEVMLTIYDVLGRPVAQLVNRRLEAGKHEIRFDAGSLPSGIYLARLQTGDQIRVRKLVLQR